MVGYFPKDIRSTQNSKPRAMTRSTTYTEPQGRRDFLILYKIFKSFENTRPDDVIREIRRHF